MKIQDVLYYVTGGSSGLGLATVTELYNRGAYVAILDVNVEAGERAAREHGKRAIFVKCDITSSDEMDNAITAVSKAFEGITLGGVVHAGGVGATQKAIDSTGKATSLADFRQVVDVNLTGSFNVASKIAAQIIRTNPLPRSSEPPVQDDRGVIILVSSVSYCEGQMGMGAYASSKAGVVGLVLPLAREFARYGIRVQAIAPTVFVTPMGNAIDHPSIRKNLMAATLFPPRFGQPEEFAHMAICIIENQMLNASVIRLDGGSRVPKL